MFHKQHLFLISESVENHQHDIIFKAAMEFCVSKPKHLWRKFQVGQRPKPRINTFYWTFPQEVRMDVP